LRHLFYFIAHVQTHLVTYLHIYVARCHVQWRIQRGGAEGPCPYRSPRPNFDVAKVCRIQGWKTWF